MPDNKDTPLMPKATAVWLVENTSLTFEQIADFCGLHVLEVKVIADDEQSKGVKGMDPISSSQLTRDEIERAQKDPNYRMRLLRSTVVIPEGGKKRRKRPKYVPVSKRQDRPNAILWLVRNHPELKESQIIRLVGTTKPTIEKIRDRTHANMAAFQPVDPVALGLCTQAALDLEVARAARRIEREGGEMPQPAPGASLLPAEETIAASGHNPFDQPQQMDEFAGSDNSSGLTSAEQARKAADSLFTSQPAEEETGQEEEAGPQEEARNTQPEENEADSKD